MSFVFFGRIRVRRHASPEVLRKSPDLFVRNSFWEQRLARLSELLAEQASLE